METLPQTLTNRAENADSELPELEAQMQSVKAELTRLTNALLVSDDKPEIVLRMISEREMRLTQLKAHLTNARRAPSVHETKYEVAPRVGLYPTKSGRRGHGRSSTLFHRRVIDAPRYQQRLPRNPRPALTPNQSSCALTEAFLISAGMFNILLPTDGVVRARAHKFVQ